jgi:hypothetical protein
MHAAITDNEPNANFDPHVLVFSAAILSTIVGFLPTIIIMSFFCRRNARSKMDMNAYFDRKFSLAGVAAVPAAII